MNLKRQTVVLTCYWYSSGWVDGQTSIFIHYQFSVTEGTYSTICCIITPINLWGIPPMCHNILVCIIRFPSITAIITSSVWNPQISSIKIGVIILQWHLYFPKCNQTKRQQRYQQNILDTKNYIDNGTSLENPTYTISTITKEDILRVWYVFHCNLDHLSLYCHYKERYIVECVKCFKEPL